MIVLVFIFGLIIGSFLNAYLWRLKNNESVWRGRSKCPNCQKTLKWYELIPLASFIIQKGRCRGCKQKIDLQYPLVEVATAVLFILAFNEIFNFQSIFNQFSIFSWLNLVLLYYFIAILIILFVYDLRYGLVPNKVVVPGIIISFIANVVVLFFYSTNNFTLYTLHLPLATAVGAGFFALQYFLSRGRWVGAGDIFFGALMGAMVGWPLIIVALAVSYIIGGLAAGFLLLLGKKKFGQTVPMGTFLAIGTIITLLWGREILNIYWPI